MHIETPGIVLRKVAYSGSAVIATIYTRRYGTLAFLVRGVSGKRAKSARSGGLPSAALESLAQVDISLVYREKNRVQTAERMGISPKSVSGGTHPVRSAMSLFLAEVLFKSLREEAPDPDLYDFISSALDFFHESDFDPDFHLVFLMKLSGFFGFPPSGEWDASAPYFDLLNGAFTPSYNASLHTLDKDSSKAFAGLMVKEFGEEAHLKKAERSRLLDALITYFRLHLEGMGEIKSLQVLREVFS